MSFPLIHASIISQSEPVILVTGGQSKTAEALARVWQGFGRKNVVFTSSSATAPRYGEFPMQHVDITNRKNIKECCLAVKPDVIVNTAAFTNVDACEIERQKAWTANVHAVENLVQAARTTDAHLIHFSTDYIFDGLNGPYSETNIPNPLGYYAKTKLASENVCIGGNIEYSIIRTNVLYGATKSLKPDFALWVLNKLEEGKPFSVVDDQFSNPTLIDDLALMVEKIIQTRQQGIFNSGGATWQSRYETARAIAEQFKFNPDVIGTMKTSDLNQPAPRPMRGGLTTFKTETTLGMKFASITNGLITMRRQLQHIGHHKWKLS